MFLLRRGNPIRRKFIPGVAPVTIRPPKKLGRPEIIKRIDEGPRSTIPEWWMIPGHPGYRPPNPNQILYGSYAGGSLALR